MLTIMSIYSYIDAKNNNDFNSIEIIYFRAKIIICLIPIYSPIIMSLANFVDKQDRK